MEEKVLEQTQEVQQQETQEKEKRERVAYKPLYEALLKENEELKRNNSNTATPTQVGEKLMRKAEYFAELSTITATILQLTHTNEDEPNLELELNNAIIANEQKVRLSVLLKKYQKEFNTTMACDLLTSLQQYNFMQE